MVRTYSVSSVGKHEAATDLIVFTALRAAGYVDGAFNPIIKNVDVGVHKSDHPEVNRLLSSASKRQTGNQGFPEFIICDRENNIAIVIENKRDIKFHMHEKLEENISSYAVNGALWYARILKDSFDTIAIGISGTDPQSLLVDTFIWKKSADFFHNLGVHELLSIGEYRRLLSESGQIELDSATAISELADKASQINDFLRDVMGVIEHKRLYVLGSILFALEAPVFKMSYSQSNGDPDLALLINQTVERKIDGANLKHKDLIKNELKPVLLALGSSRERAHSLYPNGPLLELVRLVDSSLLKFHRNRELDMMSFFFNVFLSYSTSGGSDLGIVLTPAHITKLFCDLVDLQVDDKVLDICAGTGGFLTAAWKKIALSGAYSPDEKERFRTTSLFGVESEQSLYAISALNMFINKDGGANLAYGDSFALTDYVQSLNCNVGFLNPPYSDKIYSEISFVELLLDSLLPGGTGIVIIPVNAVSSRTKVHSDILETKKRILGKHNLLASIQMPINLFYPKGTETIILIFRTGEENEGTTWLAKYDDGYELIRQRKTRTPTPNAQLNHEALIAAYKLKTESEWSLNKELSYTDQWVYTVHESASYSLSEMDLQVVLNEYIGYLYHHHYK